MLQTLSLGVATVQFDPLYAQQYTTLGRQSNHSDDISTCVHDSGKPWLFAAWNIYSDYSYIIYIYIHFGFLEKTYVNKCQQQKNEFGKIIILHYQVMIYMKSKLCNFKKRSYQPKHH